MSSNFENLILIDDERRTICPPRLEMVHFRGSGAAHAAHWFRDNLSRKTGMVGGGGDPHLGVSRKPRTEEEGRSPLTPGLSRDRFLAGRNACRTISSKSRSRQQIAHNR